MRLLKETSLIIVMLFVCSCSLSQSNNCSEIEQETKTLLRTIIKNENIESNQFSKDSYIHCHLKYLNDSNFIAEIFLNSYNPSKTDYNYKTFEIEDFSSFIVNGCLLDEELNLQEMNQFYVPDSKYWKVLIQKQGEEYRYFELKVISKEHKDLILD